MSIIDCRGIFDHVNKPCASVSVDRRMGLDVCIYKEEFDGITRWVDTKVMLVDCMTKWQVPSDFLREALRTGKYQVIYRLTPLPPNEPLRTFSRFIFEPLRSDLLSKKLSTDLRALI